MCDLYLFINWHPRITRLKTQTSFVSLIFRLGLRQTRYQTKYFPPKLDLRWEKPVKQIPVLSFFRAKCTENVAPISAAGGGSGGGSNTTKSLDLLAL